MHKRKGKSWVVLLAACMALYFGYILVNQQRMIYVKQKEYDSMQSMVQQEKDRNELLKKEKETLNTDKYIEKIARQLGMVKSGEKVFIDVNK